MNLSKITNQKLFILVFSIYFIFGVHYFQHNQAGTGLELPINAVAWVFISLLIAITLWKSSVQQSYSYTPLLQYILLMTIALWLPYIYQDSDFKILTLGRLLGLTGGVLFFWGLYQLQLSKIQRNNILYIVMLSILFECIFSLLQRYILDETNNFGYNPHTRPSGIFQQPNVASSFFITSIAVSAMLLVNNKKLSTLKMYFINTCVFLSSWAIILNMSRTTTISLFILLLFTWPLLKSNCEYKKLKYWYLSLLFGLLTPIIIGFMADVIPSRNLSVSPRVIIYTVTAFIIYKNFFNGIGYGNFDAKYLEYQSQLNDLYPGLGFIANLDHPHNEILLWIVEGGAWIAICFTFFLIYIAKYAAKTSKNTWLFNLGIIFPISFHALTEYPFYSSITLFVLLTLLLYNLDITFYKIKTKNTNLGKFILKPFAILIPLLVIPFMLTSLQTIYYFTKFEREGYNNGLYLQKILNPYNMGVRLENAQMLYKVQHLPNATKEFIDWAEDTLQYYPRREIFDNLSFAYLTINEVDKSHSTLLKANRLFPKSPKNVPTTQATALGSIAK
jgi:O-antigen polymerase